jgi:hypothetical protein
VTGFVVDAQVLAGSALADECLPAQSRRVALVE